MKNSELIPHHVEPTPDEQFTAFFNDVEQMFQTGFYSSDRSQDIDELENNIQDTKADLQKMRDELKVVRSEERKAIIKIIKYHLKAYDIKHYELYLGLRRSKNRVL